MADNKSTRTIPVVDLGQLGLGYEQEPNDHEWQRVGQEIANAFRDMGFVYVTKHGILENQIDKLLETGTTFFHLPQHEKEQFCGTIERQQGYVAFNRQKFEENKYSSELRETYDITRPDEMPPDSVVQGFRRATADVVTSVKKLTNRILKAMALGLDLDRNFFADAHREIMSDNNMSCLRLLHYPPVPKDVKPGSTRCGTHTDFGTMTLLFQLDTSGLKVRDRKSGDWISADPIPGTILINVGDLLQYWTSNKFVATEHRVLIPEEEVQQQKSRRSFAFFINPDNPVLVKPLDESSDFQPVCAEDYVLDRLRETFRY